MSTWKMNSFPIDDSSSFVKPGSCELTFDSESDRWHLTLPLLDSESGGPAEIGVDLEQETLESPLQGQTVVDALLSYTILVKMLSIDVGGISRIVLTGFVVRTKGEIEPEDDTESVTAVEDNPPPDEDEDDRS